MRRYGDLAQVIDSVNKTMKEAKTKLKSAAALRNLTDLRPVMNNETR